MIASHTLRAEMKSAEARSMETPQVASPANTIDVTSDDDHTPDMPLPQKRSHGGSRNCKRYGDKLLALEPHNIRYFLAEKRCYCGQNCLLKLFHKGQDGEKVVYELRAQRFESKAS